MARTKKRKAKSNATPIYDQPTAFTRAHAEYVVDEVVRRGKTEVEVRRLKNAEATVQARMARRGELSERQFLAIDKFVEDWERGRLMQSTIARYGLGVDAGGGRPKGRGSGSAGGADWSDRQIAARERYVLARKAIGDKAARLLEGVFLDGVPAADMRMNDGFDYKTADKQRTAILTAIRIYADFLAAHYRIG